MCDAIGGEVSDDSNGGLLVGTEASDDEFDTGVTSFGVDGLCGKTIEKMP